MRTKVINSNKMKLSTKLSFVVLFLGLFVEANVENYAKLEGVEDLSESSTDLLFSLFTSPKVSDLVNRTEDSKAPLQNLYNIVINEEEINNLINRATKQPSNDRTKQPNNNQTKQSNSDRTKQPNNNESEQPNNSNESNQPNINNESKQPNNSNESKPPNNNETLSENNKDEQLYKNDKFDDSYDWYFYSNEQTDDFNTASGDYSQSSLNSDYSLPLNNTDDYEPSFEVVNVTSLREELENVLGGSFQNIPVKSLPKFLLTTDIVKYEKETYQNVTQRDHQDSYLTEADINWNIIPLEMKQTLFANIKKYLKERISLSRPEDTLQRLLEHLYQHLDPSTRNLLFNDQIASIADVYNFALLASSTDYKSLRAEDEPYREVEDTCHPKQIYVSFTFREKTTNNSELTFVEKGDQIDNENGGTDLNKSFRSNRAAEDNSTVSNDASSEINFSEYLDTIYLFVIETACNVQSPTSLSLELKDNPEVNSVSTELVSSSFFGVAETRQAVGIAVAVLTALTTFGPIATAIVQQIPAVLGAVFTAVSIFPSLLLFLLPLPLLLLSLLGLPLVSKAKSNLNWHIHKYPKHKTKKKDSKEKKYIHHHHNTVVKIYEKPDKPTYVFPPAPTKQTIKVILPPKKHKFVHKEKHEPFHSPKKHKSVHKEKEEPFYSPHVTVQEPKTYKIHHKHLKDPEYKRYKEKDKSSFFSFFKFW